jgi:hypothetical protein
MQKVHRSAVADKAPVPPPSPLTAEQSAFAQGKRARAAHRPASANPYRNRALHDAWHRGYRFESAHREGLRPLDTVRRVP